MIDLINKIIEGLVWRATWHAYDACSDNEAPAGTCVLTLNDLSDLGWSWVHRPYHDFVPMKLPTLNELIAGVSVLHAEGQVNDVVEIDYTNHRGERRVRKIRPTGRIDFHQLLPWHPVVQWLLEADDLETGTTKWWAMQSIHSWKAAETPVLHILSQEGQPYGSERRCCNHCGIMIWGALAPAHVTNWTDWRASLSNCGNEVQR